MIRKVLVANRGEIACRIIRTCRAMGIATVAVYSDVDQYALHVELADEAIHIGGNNPAASYLNSAAILDAMKRTRADAVHPGYGFLAENAGFAYSVRGAGLTFIGPAPESIEAMGNKATAKQFLQNIPYVPGYVGQDQSDEALIAAAENIGYPIMVKAAAGGGGKGMRLVEQAGQLPDALAAARREAAQAFGDDRLMLEKALVRPRHIEVQIIGDTEGNVIALGERECSIQRRHQKIVEEAPAYNLPMAVREDMQRTAIEIAKQLGYYNAGTIEFLLDGDDHFYFMEMNTRLQVEHPVTEAVYAVDLVRWQIEIAQGTSLQQLLPPWTDVNYFSFEPDGHAVEVRVYAEDPYNDFLPVVGDIVRWDLPDGVRIDTGIRSGDAISTHYDPMIAKVIAHARDRRTALRKLDYALSQLVLLGIHNNLRFLRNLLRHSDLIVGNINTQFIENHPELFVRDDEIPLQALIAVSLAKQGNQTQWRNNRNRPIQHVFRSAHTRYTVALVASAPSRYAVTINEQTFDCEVLAHTDGHLRLAIDGHQQRFTLAATAQDIWWVHCASGAYRLQWETPLPLPRVAQAEQGSLRAPMPGQVLQVYVARGDTVQAGDVLLIIEAMKMEHRIEAPYSGVVEALNYAVGDTVQADAILLAIRHADIE